MATESVVLYPSRVDTTNSRYYAISSSYPESAIVGKSTSNTDYGVGVNLNRNTGSETKLFIEFDVSSIPQDAVIDSVKCVVAIYGPDTFADRTSTRNIQLCKGTTTVGTAVDWSVRGTVDTPEITNGGSWTRSELDTLKLLVYVVRNSSDTTLNTYFYTRGADLTITYHEELGNTYTVTVKATDVVVDKSGDSDVSEGNSFVLTIIGDKFLITDNGTDVVSKLVEQSSSGSGEITRNPVSYTTSGFVKGAKYKNAVGKGSDETATGNDYANSSGSTVTIYYAFDFSDIPTNAVIESVTVKVGGHLESTKSSSEVANLQLYSGSNTKGSQSSFSSTSKQIITMSPGTWTRDELQNAKLAFTIGYYGGLVNGVDFIVSYSVPSSGDKTYTYTINSVNSNHVIVVSISGSAKTKYRVKVNGSYKAVIKILQKTNGVWIEKTDNLDANAKYVQTI